jgi:hypothetical protein
MALSDTVMAYVDDNATNHFQDRCRYFYAKYAVAVMAEADTVADHEKRVDFAGQVLSGSFPDRELAIAVATNSTIGATIDGSGTPPDNDIEYVVQNETYNAFALSVV